jgi:hypothetical protein
LQSSPSRLPVVHPARRTARHVGGFFRQTTVTQCSIRISLSSRVTPTQRWAIDKRVAVDAEGDALDVSDDIFKRLWSRGTPPREFHGVGTDPDVSLPDLLAGRVKRHYIDEEAARTRLLEAARTLSTFDATEFSLTEEQIEEALNEERDAALPNDWKKGDQPKQLDVRRSEFAEIIAGEVLGALFGTALPASRIAEKEIVDQPTRGADIVGLENLDGDKLVLLLCEVKGSQEGKSPPGVVAGMVTKLKDLSTNRRSLIQELIWLRDHASDDYAARCADICGAYLLRRQLFDLLLVPILIRSADTAKESDYKAFEDSKNFNSPIRWISVVIEGDIYEIAVETYRKAREGAA